MCSLDEADRAYQYLGFPGYNPHVTREAFEEKYNHINTSIEERRHRPSEEQKTLLINSLRIFAIAAEDGSDTSWVEREDRARTYFDLVRAVELSASRDPQDRNKIVMQIYIVNEAHMIYGFRPVVRNGYLFNALRQVGYMLGRFRDLKRRIDWTYIPEDFNKDEVEFICGPSYFKKHRRMRLQEKMLQMPFEHIKEPNWYHWRTSD